MSSNKLARRYALALIKLGKESNALGAISESLNDFSDVLALSDRLLHKCMNNPAISIEEKRATIESVAQKLQLHPFVKNVTHILLERKRLSIFPNLVASFDGMADAELNRVRATVTTANNITEEEKTKLRNTLSQSHSVSSENLIVEFTVDESIIGGIVAKVGDRIYDGSIRSQLKEIQNVLK
ncbi:MAG: ATP synthase F1 subunit delta [Deltaproteobacteria bacterium]|nr:ATP synthase F1 subunit delta [Deltaproteobacteria bacterium]